MIELTHLRKTFKLRDRDVCALNDVSLSVQAGEIVGIIGYSGAGKSTLVRCINCLTRPDSGSVRVNNVQLTGLSDEALREARQKIGMVFQQFSLMPTRTVYENIRLPMRSGMLSPQKCREKILRLLDRVHLGDKVNAYPSELSGGQQQRVAIARALVNDPSVLLCDEATSALDPKTTASILSLLKELNRDLHLTIVVITHEMSVIKALCDKVVIMKDGSIVESGRVQDVFLHPQTALAREFIAQADNWGTFLDRLDLAFFQARQERVLAVSWPDPARLGNVFTQIQTATGVNVRVLYTQTDYLKDSMLMRCAVAVPQDFQSMSAVTHYCRNFGAHVCDLMSSGGRPC